MNIFGKNNEKVKINMNLGVKNLKKYIENLLLVEILSAKTSTILTKLTEVSIEWSQINRRSNFVNLSHSQST